MAYVKVKYPLGKKRNVIEVEEYYNWRYGAKGEKRKTKKKATPEVIRKQNEWQAEKKLRRKIYHNFDNTGWHLILTYHPKRRPDPDGAKRQLKYFLNKIRREYKKLGLQFKYIVTTEWQNKSIHHHLIIENYTVDNKTTTDIVRDAWKKNGSPIFKGLYEEGEFEGLANYIIKETQETFRSPDNPNKLRYSCSRNLQEPPKEKRIMRGKEWNKEPKPYKNYYIDKESFFEGINPVTGYRYRHYKMIKVMKMRI